MSLALTTQAVNNDLRSKRLYVIATASGAYTTGGDTVNLSAIKASLGQSGATIGYPGKISHAEVTNFPAGYTANLIPGSNLTNWKLQIYTSGGAELAAAAYPAAIIATPFVFEIEGPKGRI
jgi:hypothetical protein